MAKNHKQSAVLQETMGYFKGAPTCLERFKGSEKGYDNTMWTEWVHKIDRYAAK